MEVTRLAGRQAVAVVDSRIILRPDPERLREALGSRAFEAMRVSVTAARRLLAEEDLKGISESSTTPVLCVEAIR